MLLGLFDSFVSMGRNDSYHKFGRRRSDIYSLLRSWKIIVSYRSSNGGDNWRMKRICKMNFSFWCWSMSWRWLKKMISRVLESGGGLIVNVGTSIKWDICLRVRALLVREAYSSSAFRVLHNQLILILLTIIFISCPKF